MTTDRTTDVTDHSAEHAHARTDDVYAIRTDDVHEATIEGWCAFALARTIVHTP